MKEDKTPINSSSHDTEETMITNLPLLFCNGKPVSLEQITLPEILRFIPFMVKCSMGKGKEQDTDLKNCSIPQWWPIEQFPFRFPLRGPSYKHEKLQDLRKLVYRCYMFYKCEFLLKFSCQLSVMSNASIKYVRNNDNETTCIYHKNGTLLVKFRNENLLYDAGIHARKHLYPIIHSPSQVVSKKPICIDLTELSNESSDDEKINDERLNNKPSKEESSGAESANLKTGKRKRKHVSKEIDFDLETEPSQPQDQDGFLKLFDLQKSEPGNEDVLPNNDKKKIRLLNQFVYLPVSSLRGQKILDKARYAVNTNYYVDKIERYTSTSGAPSQISTRTARSSTVKPSTLVPETVPNEDDNSETALTYTHTYRWPKRCHNPQRMHRGPTIKECFVKLEDLSDDVVLSILRPNLKSKGTMTPIEWQDDAVICDCSFSGTISYEKRNNSKTRNKSCSTRCICQTGKNIHSQNRSHHCKKNVRKSNVSKNYKNGFKPNNNNNGNQAGKGTETIERIRTRSVGPVSPKHSECLYNSCTEFVSPYIPFTLNCTIPQVKRVIRTPNTNTFISTLSHIPLKDLKLPKMPNNNMEGATATGVLAVKSRCNTPQVQQNMEHDFKTRRHHIISKPDSYIEFSQPLQENLIPTNKVSLVKRKNHYPKAM